MVRTKANVASASIRVTAEKAPRKNFSSARSSNDFSSPSGKKDKGIGGNPVCARPTPAWQKPIANFFTTTSKQPEKPEEDKHDAPRDKNGETVPEHFHDDKENRNPVDEGQSSSAGQPEASTSSKTKRRRILMVDSDSEEETTSGCIVSMKDSISTC